MLDLYDQCAEAYMRDALMWLVMGAFEEYHGTEPPSHSLWLRIEALLRRDYSIHRELIEYYSCQGEADDTFPVTPLMRLFSVTE